MFKPSDLAKLLAGKVKRPRRVPLDRVHRCSFLKNGVVDGLVGAYGHLIEDDCYHLSGHSFEQVARRAGAKFVTGLSATVTPYKWAASLGKPGLTNRAKSTVSPTVMGFLKRGRS